MPRMNFGAHISAAGGLHQVFARGDTVGCRTLQLFTKSERQWQAKPLTDEAIAQFKTAAGQSCIRPIMAHASYLINLASPKDDLWERSIAAFGEELRRCAQLEIPMLVLHPGAHTGAGAAAGIERVAEALDRLFEGGVGDPVQVLLETTAGQGSCLAGSFEELAQMLDLLRRPDRAAVCVDTCHIFAAGYNITTDEGYTTTFDRLVELIGQDRIKAFHLNDSKGGLGSHLDRHEHIGEGMIGLDGFRRLVNDPRFSGTPMILETPKSDDGAEDIRNLTTLRGLRSPSSSADPIMKEPVVSL